MRSDSVFDPEALRSARVRAGLTQGELARLIEVAGGERVSKWELGAAAPRPVSVRRIADVLGVRPSDLLRLGGAEDLRRLRANRGLTAKELAEQAHVSLATLLRWEEEGLQHMPDVTSLGPLADALGVTVAEVEAALVRSRGA